jgi:hypothetical protein
MTLSKILKALVLAAAMPLLYLADANARRGAGLPLVREAQAIVGAPLTPVSVAGVARRTTVRRVVPLAETTAVAATTASTSGDGAATGCHRATAAGQAATKQLQTATAQQQASTAAPAAQNSAAARTRGRTGDRHGRRCTCPKAASRRPGMALRYQNCGGVYYRAAFQGNNLVYVVQ